MQDTGDDSTGLAAERTLTLCSQYFFERMQDPTTFGMRWPHLAQQGVQACRAEAHALHVRQDFEAKLEEEAKTASPPQPEPAQAGVPGMAPPSQGNQGDDEDGEQADSNAAAQQAKWEVCCALCGLDEGLARVL